MLSLFRKPNHDPQGRVCSCSSMALGTDMAWRGRSLKDMWARIGRGEVHAGQRQNTRIVPSRIISVRSAKFASLLRNAQLVVVQKTEWGWAGPGQGRAGPGSAGQGKAGRAGQHRGEVGRPVDVCCVRSGANRAAARRSTSPPPLRNPCNGGAPWGAMGRRWPRAWGFVFPLLPHTLAHASPPYLPLDRAPSQSRPGRSHPQARTGAVPTPPVRLRTGSAAERGAARLA